MIKTRIGVIRGGPSNEYDVSLKSGAAVLRNLPEHYKPVDILIDKEGLWHVNGIPMELQRVFSQIDVVFNALHGYFGEDGKLQQILETYGVPYTGSKVLASAMGMNKVLSKNIFKKHRLKTPYAITVEPFLNLPEEIARIYRMFPQPSVVKPFNGGSSVGTAVVHTFEDFRRALENAQKFSNKILIEEYINGREATCGIIENFREEELYALPPVEIIPPSNRFFDYETKYNGSTQEMCPSHFSEEVKHEIMRHAIKAHRALDLRHYSRSDFIISDRGIYILETNTLPGLTEESLFPKACDAIGCSFPEFLDHTIKLALNN